MGETNLELLYENVLSASPKDFLIELKIYMGYLTSDLKFKKIIRNLEKEREDDFKEYEHISTKIINRCKNVYSLLNSLRNPNDKVKSLLTQFKGYLDGNIRSSMPLPESLMEMSQDCIEEAEGQIKKSLIGIKTELTNLHKEYWKIKEKFKGKRRISNWLSYKKLESLKYVDLDISNLDFWEKLDIGFYQKEVEMILSGKKQIDPTEKNEYLKHLKRLHTFVKIHSDEIGIVYGDELKQRFDEYKRESHNKNLFNRILLALGYFIKEISIIFGLAVFLYASIFIKVIYDALKKEFVGTYIQLGIPKIDVGFIRGFSIIFLFAVGLLYLAKYYLRFSETIKHVLSRILNGYFLLFIYLIIVASYVGGSVLKHDYGSTLPKEFDLNNYVNENYDNFSKDNIINFSTLSCKGGEGDRFFIKDKGAVCDFSIHMKNDSNFTFFKVKEFIITEEEDFVKMLDMGEETNDHSIPINLNVTSGFRAHIHFIFLNNNSDEWDYVYSVRYDDESISKEDYKELEERKNIFLFSLMSILIFSIISAVVNLKHITESPKK